MLLYVFVAPAGTGHENMLCHRAIESHSLAAEAAGRREERELELHTERLFKNNLNLAKRVINHRLLWSSLNQCGFRFCSLKQMMEM